MIETTDRRKFFTHEKNFPMLIDFAKTFNAEISVVKLEEGQILDLAELAPALCDAGYRRPRSSYQLIETKCHRGKFPGWGDSQSCRHEGKIPPLQVDDGLLLQSHPQSDGYAEEKRNQIQEAGGG
jgi:hypothetical protein